MQYTLKNKTIELTDEEVSEIVKQNSKSTEEKKVGLEIKHWLTGKILFTSTKTTWKEAVEEANFNGADLREADFRGANFNGTDFSEANLPGANFNGTDFSEANLSGANFNGTDLREANFSGANFNGTDFSEANLRGANFTGTDLREADFRGAKMMLAKFYGKGGNTKIKRNQVDDLLEALGIVVED